MLSDRERSSGLRAVSGPRVGDHVRQTDMVRALVSASWGRSLAYGLVRDAFPIADVDDDDLRDYRGAHPLARVLPVIQQLLVRHTVGSGLIVAIGDHNGRLLWVDGDRDMRRRAETMGFLEGADWSEQSVGTAAPGTALTLGHSVQITQDEHFSRLVHPWSCSAVPVRNRSTGRLLGVIDITGGNDAVAPVTLPLLEATVAAVEAELSLMQGLELASKVSRAAPAQEPELNVLGSDEGMLHVGQTHHRVSLRRAELLTLLAWHPSGMNAGELAFALYGREDAAVTLRAEMVRFRKLLADVDPGLVPQSRPYRLPRPLQLDARRVLDLLDRGAHRMALSVYCGPVLPGSTAPGIAHIRHLVSARLRESLLSGASVDILLTYAQLPEAHYDVELWRTCLHLLPLKSPRRAAVVEHVERIEFELA